MLTLPSRGAAPQDVKLSPDGAVFYVADMNANGVWLIDGATFRVLALHADGRGRARALPEPRRARTSMSTNRGEGRSRVITFATRHVVKKWRIPGGGSPDMGNVSADGKVLWLSGRYNGVVYAISTQHRRLLAKIPVGARPARALRLAAAGPVLARSHRHPPVGGRLPEATCRLSPLELQPVCRGGGDDPRHGMRVRAEAAAVTRSQRLIALRPSRTKQRSCGYVSTSRRVACAAALPTSVSTSG